MNYIEILQKNNLLKKISEPVDIDLEIAHISYIEVKKEDSKALLFTNVIDKNGKKYPNVITNIFGSFKALNLIMQTDPDKIAKEIENLLKPKKPENFMQKLSFLNYLFNMRKIFTKRLKAEGECQKNKIFGDDINLFDLPVLKTWELDGGQFITMGQVYTQSIDGNLQNLGMYRLQILDKNKLAMHWQIHKDGSNFFNEYKKANKKMPVSVAIGGDPLYIWCGQAPLPKGVFELLLYGFIRKSPAKLVKSLTNEIYIPNDVDYVIEGFVDTNHFEDEGPFGDHTGFYTPIKPFPVMKVSAITHKDNPIFQATVVGKPPLEDKFMGYATERIFLPLLKTTTPELIDYNMPENGVFHNLILAKLNILYPYHAKQTMHAFWGVGQMSFVKHGVFVSQNAPNLQNYEELSKYVLNRISPKSLLFSEGICDELDHASPNSCYGGKLGIDASVDLSTDYPKILSDDEILAKFKKIDNDVLNVKQYFVDTKNPIIFISYNKNKLVKDCFKELLKFRENFKILIFFDANENIENLYMSVWRITNNIDANRDIFIDEDQICIDASSKGELENYNRQWPKPTNCNPNVIDSLISRGLIEDDEEFFRKFEII